MKKQKYTDEELAEAHIFPNDLSKEEISKEDKKFSKFIKKEFGKTSSPYKKFWNFINKKWRHQRDKLYGPEVIESIRKYVKKNPEVKLIDVEDASCQKSIIIVLQIPGIHESAILFVPEFRSDERMFLMNKEQSMLLEKCLSEINSI